MKAVLFSLLMISGPAAFANSGNAINDLVRGDSLTSLRACKEGTTQIFPNDGQCRYGQSRTTVKKCINGRYVTIRSYCESN